mmetsp:Transcript_11009/g.26982  ORF Transcript_11009/g.26982 Transcript_11009/m.26982 type:complete len:375 (+) Transcript_11009:243-1367(+)
MPRDEDEVEAVPDSHMFHLAVTERKVCCNCLGRGTVPCLACASVFYCSPQCREEDAPGHQQACKAVSRAVGRVEEEAAKLRDCEGVFSPRRKDCFVEDVGSFWDLPETRDYCRARLELINKLSTEFDNPTATKRVLLECLDMLRLSRRDALGVRNRVPNALLVLGLDQECYDFIKFWAEDGGLGELDDPYLHYKNEDISEPLLPGMSSKYCLSLSHVVALVLVKFRQLKRLQARHCADITTFLLATQDRLGEDSHAHVLHSCGPALEIIHRDSEPTEIASLRGQIECLLATAEKHNKGVWRSLLNPAPIFQRRPPEHMSKGSEEELWVTLLGNRGFLAWNRTEGAIAMLKQYMSEKGDDEQAADFGVHVPAIED